VPDVSVLMPVRNAARFVRAAVDSVLLQRGPSVELIVVDDGSTDGSRAIVEAIDDRRVRLIRHEPGPGISATLNAGLASATGEFVARLDADDVARPDRFAKQVDALRRMPAVVLTGSRARLIDANGRAIGLVDRPCDETAIRWYNLLDNAFVHSSVMFRRAAIAAEFGGYDESLSLCEDWALWGRIMEGHAVCNMPEPLTDYRVTPGSIMSTIESTPSNARRVVLEQTARRLIRRHVTATLGSAAAGDVDDLSAFLLGAEPSAVPRVLAAFERLLERFLEAVPGAIASPEFCRTVARQFDALAYRVQPPSRASACRIYRAAARRGAATVRWLPLGRMTALITFGRAGRDRLRQARRTSFR